MNWLCLTFLIPLKLTADQDVDNYWIRANPNFGNVGFTDGINSAILRYDGAAIVEPSATTAPDLTNPLVEANLHPLASMPVVSTRTSHTSCIDSTFPAARNCYPGRRRLGPEHGFQLREYITGIYVLDLHWAHRRFTERHVVLDQQRIFRSSHCTSPAPDHERCQYSAGPPAVWQCLSPSRELVN